MGLTFSPGVRLTVLAAEAIPKQRFVGFDGNLCGAGAKALGASEIDFGSGEYAGVIGTGSVIVEAAEAIAVGGGVESDADGKAAALDTGTVNGYAMTAAAQAGDLIVVKLA